MRRGPRVCSDDGTGTAGGYRPVLTPYPEPALPADHRRTSHVLRETVILATMCLGDLLFTSYLLATGHGIEANPVMALAYSRFGPYGFVLVKAALVGIPLVIAETSRPYCERLVIRSLRTAIAAYGLLWFLGTVAINRWV